MSTMKTAAPPKHSISSQEPLPRVKSRKSSPSMRLSQAGRISYRLTPVDEAILKFRSTCQKYRWTRMPIPLPYDEKKGFFSDGTDDLKIWLSFKKSGNDEVVDKVIFKNSGMETNLLIVLEEWQRLYRSITTLKLEYCVLTSEQIEVLADLIKSRLLIRDVSINGNPNSLQNFHILLKDTKLLSLSLKFCDIDVDGIKMISEVLSKPMEHPLLHLNLASNRLFDDGAEYAAKFLRINRVLVSLNLADNKIRNKGCQLVTESLQKFCLNHDEIVIRRRIKFELHRQEILEAAAEVNKSSIVRKTSSKTSKKSLKEKASQSSLSMRKKKSSSWCMIPETTYHPFVQDTEELDIEGLDTEFYCKGNDTLTNLNLSYNRIKQEGLQSVINMLDYQRNNYANDKGISRISLEGNEVNGLGEIEKLLAKRIKPSITSSRSRSQNSMTKSQRLVD